MAAVPIFWGVSVAMISMIMSASAYSQELRQLDTMLEQIIVTSALHRNRAETVLPVNVLAGDELREKVSSTLGDMLQNQVGVNNASFGARVGLPVIRGQSANRVQILQMGVGNLDASSVSPDHANSLEPALAERIEVIRGPATLLYGNGAIGGVVNVIDGRIPRSRADAISALTEIRYDSVSDQRTGIMKLEGGTGRFAWHLSAVDRQSNDVEVSGFALNPALVNLADPEAYSELIASNGRLLNSNSASDSQTVGASWILEGGWVGIAFNQMDNEYGLPRDVHAQHGHSSDVAAKDHVAQHGEEEGDIRIVMKQDRWDF